MSRLSEVVERRFSRLAPYAGAAAVCAVYLLLAGRSTLWDRDEPRFARATVEMIRSGNYLYPTFNGELRPDKPILIYWLMSVPMRWMGPTDFAGRFLSPVAMAVSCLLTWYLGRLLMGARAGLWAMGILATTPLALISGTAATTDAVLLVLILGVVALFVRACDGGGIRAPSAIAMGVLLGAATLTKGPVGLAVPLPALAVPLIADRQMRGGAWRSAGWLAVAVALGVGIFLAWAIPANRATGGEYLAQGLGRHVVGRATEALESHGGDYWLYLPYYLPVVLLGFLPWVLHLPAALSRLGAGRTTSPRGRALLLGWMLGTFVLMTLVATKLPHYVLPVWPALALAVGGLLAQPEAAGSESRDLRWLRCGLWLFAPLAFAVGLVSAIGPWFLPVAGLRLPCLILGVLIVATASVASVIHRRGRYARAAVTLIIGVVAVHLAVALLVLPAVEQLKVSPRIARAIRDGTPADTPVAVHGYSEPSLIFYLDRGPVRSLDDEAAVAAWAREPGPGVLVITRTAREQLQDPLGSSLVKELAAASGFNYSKGRWIELVALSRGGAGPSGD